ncbi:hypothetical protein LOK49_LG03G00499 [Camellia lanceoleosa]|uniref:Uncharacterized protein n=1 Tax=Camellia lanceoleosa TaxID=1840588 RepID=A0ACC0I8G7_9ERIC|nr:hypothetical protein LOK49_LG03G00499 [Camellia lanceoleosa]
MVLFTFEAQSNAPIGHVGINQKPFCCSHTKPIEPEEVPVNCKADHLDFNLKLGLPTNCISIFEPFYGDNSPILDVPFVHIPKTTLPNYVLAAKVVCGNLKFSELEPLQVSKQYFSMMLL